MFHRDAGRRADRPDPGAPPTSRHPGPLGPEISHAPHRPRPGARLLAVIAGSLLATMLSGASSAQTLLRQPAYRATADGPLQPWYVLDSKWGFVARFNLALADRLRNCAVADGDALSATLEIAPNRFGPVSRRALDALAACAPELRVSTEGSVGVADWRAIAPGAALPTPMEKARAISYPGAGLASDYDDAFWNEDAAPSAGEAAQEVFTWGPAKATVVDGCFVQRVVRRVLTTPSGQAAVDRAFVENRGDLALLMEAGCASSGAAMAPIYADPVRREAFVLAVRALGSTDDGRAAYDGEYLGTDGPWARRIRAYYAVYAGARRAPTETDFAMFLELARGAPALSASDVAARTALVRSARGAPALARMALIDALSFASPAARSFARGRLMAYVIDGVGDAGLDAADLAAWAVHGRVRASDVGLDERPYLPCDVIPDVPGCRGERK